MRGFVIIPVVVAILVTALSSVFIVDERKKALVLQFGEVKQVKEDPGLGFKLPLIQNVARFDDRILQAEGLRYAAVARCFKRLFNL